jgi:hypothetical protein
MNALQCHVEMEVHVMMQLTDTIAPVQQDMKALHVKRKQMSASPTHVKTVVFVMIK